MNATDLSAVKELEKLLLDIKVGKKTVVATTKDHFGRDERLSIMTRSK